MYKKTNRKSKKYHKKYVKSRKIYKSKTKKLKYKKRKTRTRKQYGGDYNPQQIQLIKNKFQELGFNETEINNFLIEINKSASFFGDDINKVLAQMESFTIFDKEKVQNWVKEMGELSSDVDTNYEYSQPSQLSQLSSYPSSQDSVFSDDGYESSQVTTY